MTMKHRMLLAVAVSAGLVAGPLLAQAPPAPQDVPPPIVPAQDAPIVTPPASAPKSDAKKAVKKPAKPAPKKEPAKPEVTKAANPEPAVAISKNVNVRGQANINSEVVTHLKRGELVTILEEITLKSPKADEPAKWAKIALPSGTPLWVSALFVDKNTKTVTANKLRLRSGPGENYSTVGMIDKGTVLKELETKGDWIKVESPAGSYAFVAAHLLSKNPADVGPAMARANPPPPVATPAVATPPPPPPTTTVVETQPPVTAPVDTVVTPAPVATPPPVTPTPLPAILTAPPAAPTAPVVETEPPADEPLPKRIVTREGVVRGSASIQSPSYYVLKSLDNNRTINYLHSPTTNIIVKEYLYQRVIVTGEELLDERWPNVPVIDIETIQTVP